MAGRIPIGSPQDFPNSPLAMVTADNVQLRSAASEKSPSLGRMDTGTLLLDMGEGRRLPGTPGSPQGWAAVRSANGINGFAGVGFLRFEGQAPERPDQEIPDDRIDIIPQNPDDDDIPEPTPISGLGRGWFSPSPRQRPAAYGRARFAPPIGAVPWLAVQELHVGRPLRHLNVAAARAARANREARIRNLLDQANYWLSMSSRTSTSNQQQKIDFIRRASVLTDQARLLGYTGPRVFVPSSITSGPVIFGPANASRLNF